MKGKLTSFFYEKSVLFYSNSSLYFLDKLRDNLPDYVMVTPSIGTFGNCTAAIRWIIENYPTFLLKEQYFPDREAPWIVGGSYVFKMNTTAMK